MPRRNDAASQTERDDAVVAQLPDHLVGIPGSASLLHALPGRDIGEGDPYRDDIVGSERAYKCRTSTGRLAMRSPASLSRYGNIAHLRRTMCRFRDTRVSANDRGPEKRH